MKESVLKLRKILQSSQTNQNRKKTVCAILGGTPSQLLALPDEVLESRIENFKNLIRTRNLRRYGKACRSEIRNTADHQQTQKGYENQTINSKFRETEVGNTSLYRLAGGQEQNDTSYYENQLDAAWHDAKESVNHSNFDGAFDSTFSNSRPLERGIDRMVGGQDDNVSAYSYYQDNGFEYPESYVETGQYQGFNEYRYHAGADETTNLEQANLTFSVMDETRPYWDTQTYYQHNSMPSSYGASMNHLNLHDCSKFLTMENVCRICGGLRSRGGKSSFVSGCAPQSPVTPPQRHQLYYEMQDYQPPAQQPHPFYARFLGGAGNNPGRMTNAPPPPDDSWPKVEFLPLSQNVSSGLSREYDPFPPDDSGPNEPLPPRTLQDVYAGPLPNRLRPREDYYRSRNNPNHNLVLDDTYDLMKKDLERRVGSESFRNSTAIPQVQAPFQSKCGARQGNRCCKCNKMKNPYPPQVAYPDCDSTQIVCGKLMLVMDSLKPSQNIHIRHRPSTS